MDSRAIELPVHCKILTCIFTFLVLWISFVCVWVCIVYSVLRTVNAVIYFYSFVYCCWKYCLLEPLSQFLDQLQRFLIKDVEMTPHCFWSKNSLDEKDKAHREFKRRWHGLNITTGSYKPFNPMCSAAVQIIWSRLGCSPPAHGFGSLVLLSLWNTYSFIGLWLK